MVEVDVRETGDGHLILLHDDLVDRTTNKTGQVAEMSLEQVQRLNAGEWQRIPSLEEALEVATGKVGLILELKVEGIGAEASSIVKRIGFTGSLIYASFLPQELMRVRPGGTGCPDDDAHGRAFTERSSCRRCGRSAHRMSASITAPSRRA